MVEILPNSFSTTAKPESGERIYYKYDKISDHWIVESQNSSGSVVYPSSQDLIRYLVKQDPTYPFPQEVNGYYILHTKFIPLSGKLDRSDKYIILNKKLNIEKNIRISFTTLFSMKPVGQEDQSDYARYKEFEKFEKDLIEVIKTLKFSN